MDSGTPTDRLMNSILTGLNQSIRWWALKESWDHPSGSSPQATRPLEMSPLLDPAKLESTLASIQLVKYMSLAAMVTIVYDYCLTFDLEIGFIWPQKWTFMKLLFIATRYLPFFDILISFIPEVLAYPDDLFCKVTFDVAAASFGVGYFLTELAMSIWVWSLWNRDKKVGVTILLLFVAAWMAIPILQIRYVSSAEVTRPSFTPLSGCFLTLDSKKTIGIFCILLAFNLVTFLATLMRVISIHADNTYIGGLSYVAFSNCLFYYVCLLVLSAVNLVVATALPREFVNVLIPMQRAMYAIISTRMMLSLRESASMKQGLLISSVEA